MRKNHPFFDQQLVAVPRESKFCWLCRSIVNACYNAQLKNAQTGYQRKVKFHTLHKLLGLVSFLDWISRRTSTLSGSSPPSCWSTPACSASTGRRRSA